MFFLCARQLFCFFVQNKRLVLSSSYYYLLSYLLLTESNRVFWAVMSALTIIVNVENCFITLPAQVSPGCLGIESDDLETR